MNQKTKKMNIEDAINIFGSHFVLVFKNGFFSIKECIGKADVESDWKNEFKTIDDAKIECSIKNDIYIKTEINKIEDLNSNLIIQLIEFLTKNKSYKNKKLEIERKKNLIKFLNEPTENIIFLLNKDINVPENILDVKKEYYLVDFNTDYILENGIKVDKVKVVHKNIFIIEDFNTNVSFDLENEDGSVDAYITNEMLYAYENDRYFIGCKKYLYDKEDNIKMDVFKSLELSKKTYQIKIDDINNILKK